VLIKEIIEILEGWAHPSLQESYDNSKLIAGDRMRACSGVLVSLDCTEAIVQEAVDRGCNLIVSHHPILFSPLKSLTGKTYPERTIIAALEQKIALYALHTNLDHVFSGVNMEMSVRLGLKDTLILRPTNGKMLKLVTYIPPDHLIAIREALFRAGAGHIGNYDQCSFNTEGVGTFRPLEGSNPYSGKKGQLEEDKEMRLELVFHAYHKQQVLKALYDSHPYEEVAFEIYPLENSIQSIGSGMIGNLPEPMEADRFLQHVKSVFGGMIRYTRPTNGKVKRIALCGGSGSFLLPDAIASGADVFISSDFKYHQFFDADDKIMIVDIGHFEAEQFTTDLIGRYLNEKIPNFAVLLTKQSTNPVQYL
jgi:dinuclear metal center YbgI/SA1388 family protein